MPHKPRLRRLDQIFVNSPVFFVTLCTANRRKLLNNAGVQAVFLEYTGKATHFQYWVGSYVLMPDHLHLFVAVPEIGTVDLSRWIKGLKAVLSRYWNNCDIPAPHWQKGFFDHVIRNGESLAQKWEYVRQNPVRAGLCQSPEDYPFLGHVDPM